MQHVDELGPSALLDGFLTVEGPCVRIFDGSP
jgi:hypothetical protein